MEEQKTEDYKERLQKARQRRNGKDPMHWFMIGGCAVIVVLALVIIVKLKPTAAAALTTANGMSTRRTRIVGIE